VQDRAQEHEMFYHMWNTQGHSLTHRVIDFNLCTSTNILQGGHEVTWMTDVELIVV